MVFCCHQGRVNGTGDLWRHLRDVLLFCGGLAGTAHETLSSRPAQPVLLALYAAMMGLPLWLRKDGL